MKQKVINLSIIGLEPKIFLWDKIALERNWHSYTYSTSNYTYDNQNYEGNTAYTDVGMENRTTNINNFQLFGNISFQAFWSCTIIFKANKTSYVWTRESAFFIPFETALKTWALLNWENPM